MQKVANEGVGWYPLLKNTLKVNHHFRNGGYLLDDDKPVYYRKKLLFLKPTYKKC